MQNIIALTIHVGSLVRVQRELAVTSAPACWVGKDQTVRNLWTSVQQSVRVNMAARVIRLMVRLCKFALYYSGLSRSDNFGSYDKFPLFLVEEV